MPKPQFWWYDQYFSPSPLYIFHREQRSKVLKEALLLFFFLGESWVKNVTKVTKNVTEVTKNVCETKNVTEVTKNRSDWTCIVLSRGHRSKFIWSCFIQCTANEKYCYHFYREPETHLNARPFGSNMVERLCFGCLDTWPCNRKQTPSFRFPIINQFPIYSNPSFRNSFDFTSFSHLSYIYRKRKLTQRL